MADCQLVYKTVPPNPRCKATRVDISLRTLAVLVCGARKRNVASSNTGNGVFLTGERLKVGRERLRAMLNDENDASDAPKMVAILAISHPCSMPDQGSGSLALATIPDVNHVSQLPYRHMLNT